MNDYNIVISSYLRYLMLVLACLLRNCLWLANNDLKYIAYIAYEYIIW